MNKSLTLTVIACLETQHYDFNHLNPYIAKLRPELSPAKKKINYIFGTIGHRLKIQKAKLVRIKFPIELSNFYLAKHIFE